MIWVILTIIIVGAFIVDAINRNTARAEQEHENSPEYKSQARASLDYFQYLNDVLDVKIWLAETKLKLKELPNFVTVWNHRTGKDTRYLTHKKQIYEQNKKEGVKNIKLVSKNEIIGTLKKDIAYWEGRLRELEQEYKKKKKEYPGYHREDMDIIKEKYELNSPFVGDDWSTSSWKMYEEQESKLQRLEKQLRIVQKAS